MYNLTFMCECELELDELLYTGELLVYPAPKNHPSMLI